MRIALFTCTRQALALADTLRAFASIRGSLPATAILYSPKRCSLAAFASGTLYGPEGRPLDLGAVFEARVFHETAELRWLNDPRPAQHHRAVILTRIPGAYWAIGTGPSGPQRSSRSWSRRISSGARGRAG
jgi:hypothetical protein